MRPRCVVGGGCHTPLALSCFSPGSCHLPNANSLVQQAFLIPNQSVSGRSILKSSTSLPPHPKWLEAWPGLEAGGSSVYGLERSPLRMPSPRLGGGELGGALQALAAQSLGTLIPEKGKLYKDPIQTSGSTQI